MSKFYLLLALILAGCTTASGIQIVEKGNSGFDTAIIYKGKETILDVNENNEQEYRIFHQGASGFTPSTAVRHSAEKEHRLSANKK